MAAATVPVPGLVSVLQHLFLYGAVHPLCKCVLVGVSVLCHADAGLAGLQQLGVGVAAVLDAPVRVVDEPLRRLPATAAGDGHLQCPQAALGGEVLAEVPADYLAGACVRHHRQVAEAGADGHVGDVADPDSIGGVRRGVLCKVGVPAVGMERVGRPRAVAPLAHQQALPPQELAQLVPSHLDAPPCVHAPLRQQVVQFFQPKAGQLAAYLADFAEQQRGREVLRLRRCLRLVPGLPALAKRSAQLADPDQGAALAQPSDRLAPFFFRRSMPYFSLPMSSRIS